MKRDKETEKGLLKRINSLLDETEEYDDWEPTDIAYDALGLLENVKCFLEEE